MISLIIPAFNESKRLGNSLGLLAKFINAQTNEFETIVVDDGSSDNTAEVAQNSAGQFKNFKVLSIPHRGKGAAVNAGFKEASGDIVVFTDADFSTPITEITKLLSKINDGFDIAIGSRAVDRSLVKQHQNLLRETMGRGFNLVVQRLAVKGIQDTQCGFKAFNKAATSKIFDKQIIFGYGFDVELLYLAQKLGLKIAEVPVLWYNDRSSKVSPVKDSAITFYELLKTRFTHSKEKASFFDKFLYQLYRRKTFVKFVLVGLSATFVDFFGYILLTRIFGLQPLVANPINVEGAIIWSFALNNLWTFGRQNHQKKLFGKFIIFQFVTFGGLLLSQIQIFLFVHVLNLPDIIAKFITLPTVAIFNYSIHKRWTFRDVSSGSAPLLLFITLILGLLLLYLLMISLFR